MKTQTLEGLHFRNIKNFYGLTLENKKLKHILSCSTEGTEVRKGRRYILSGMWDSKKCFDTLVIRLEKRGNRNQSKKCWRDDVKNQLTYM